MCYLFWVASEFEDISGSLQIPVKLRGSKSCHSETKALAIFPSPHGEMCFYFETTVATSCRITGLTRRAGGIRSGRPKGPNINNTRALLQFTTWMENEPLGGGAEPLRIHHLIWPWPRSTYFRQTPRTLHFLWCNICVRAPEAPLLTF